MLGIVMLQLNLHETDLLFRYLCHHLTWHCSSNYEDLHRFERKSVQIFINTGTMPCHMMVQADLGSSIEIINQSHGD